MGKKTKTKDIEDDTETDTTEDTDTEIETKDKTLLDKFNGLSKKTKLYLGIFIVLLLAGLFMWYKNRKTISGQSAQPMQSQIQQIIPNNTISFPQVIQPPIVQPPVVQAPVVQAPVTQISNPVSPQNVFS